MFIELFEEFLGHFYSVIFLVFFGCFCAEIRVNVVSNHYYFTLYVSTLGSFCNA